MNINSSDKLIYWINEKINMSKEINPKVPIFSPAVTRSRSKKDLIIAVLFNEAVIK